MDKSNVINQKNLDLAKRLRGSYPEVYQSRDQREGRAEPDVVVDPPKNGDLYNAWAALPEHLRNNANWKLVKTALQSVVLFIEGSQAVGPRKVKYPVTKDLFLLQIGAAESNARRIARGRPLLSQTRKDAMASVTLFEACARLANNDNALA